MSPFKHSQEALYWIDQHRQEHRTPRRFTGKGITQWQGAIQRLMSLTEAHTMLDYGCGKALYWPSEWQGRIQGYDPAVEEFSAPPQPQDCVMCLDVMEHIPESHVPQVIDHIHSLAQRCVFWVISDRPAQKRLPCGANCHITVKPSEWWQDRCHHPTLVQEFHFG